MSTVPAVNPTLGPQCYEHRLQQKVSNTFVANLFLVPVIGTFFAGVFQKQPLLVIGIDIAGVPLVLYAFISTCIPVMVVTVFANFSL